MQINHGGTVSSKGLYRMTIYSSLSFASRAAALMLLVFAVGCDREEAPVQAPAPARPVSRAEDPAYREQLKVHIDSQKKVAHDINEIERQMELQRQRARKALGEGATDAQIVAELESNPTKYPEWGHLVGRRNALGNDMKARLAEARAAILSRISQEKQSVEGSTKPAKDGN